MIKPSDSQLLNRAECDVLRGIAILGIVLHNYTHWLRPMVKENEYTFKQGNADRMAELLSQPDWYLPAQLLSFFGHYGVPIFLFLSAFGLVMKYEQKMPATPVPATGKKESAWSFLRQHFLKLFKLMLTGFVLFVLVDGMTPRPHHYRLLDVVAQLGMFNNLLPHPERVIWPGPYWFFGLMMQLYVIYRLLLYRRSSWWVVCLMLVCTAVQMFFSPAGEELNYLRYNFVGGVLPFGLGLLFARHGRMPTQKAYCCIVLVVALLLIFLMSRQFLPWLFVPVAVCAAAIAAVKLLPAGLLGPLEWVGEISAVLFIVHPAVRKVVIPLSHQGEIYAGLLIYLIVSLVLALLVGQLLKRIPTPKSKKP